MSTPLLGMLAGALTGVAILGAMAPLLAHRRASMQPLPDGTDDRQITVLRALRDLESDRLRGALSEADYQALRGRMEAEAVAILREAEQAEAALELASAVRASRAGAAAGKGRTRGAPTKRTPRSRLASARRTWLTGLLITCVVTLGAGTVLAGAVSGRAPGGFITGTTPAGPADAAARVAQDPSDVEARLELAQQDLENGRTSDATEQYLAVVKLDPKNPEARTRLALLLYESGNTERSLQALDDVLADDPKWPEALFIKGVVLLNGLNRPTDATVALKAYLEVDPGGPYSKDAQQLLQQAGG